MWLTLFGIGVFLRLRGYSTYQIIIPHIPIPYINSNILEPRRFIEKYAKIPKSFGFGSVLSSI